MTHGIAPAPSASELAEEIRNDPGASEWLILNLSIVNTMDPHAAALDVARLLRYSTARHREAFDGPQTPQDRNRCARF